MVIYVGRPGRAWCVGQLSQRDRTTPVCLGQLDQRNQATSAYTRTYFMLKMYNFQCDVIVISISNMN